VSILDEISPLYVAARAFNLELADPNATIKAFDVVEINIDYADAQPEGAKLPLELLVVAPTPENFRRTVFRRVIPSSIFFKPVEGGAHTVVLREVGHNAWRGSLVVDIEGDPLNLV